MIWLLFVSHLCVLLRTAAAAQLYAQHHYKRESTHNNFSLSQLFASRSNFLVFTNNTTKYCTYTIRSTLFRHNKKTDISQKINWHHWSRKVMMEKLRTLGLTKLIKNPKIYDYWMKSFNVDVGERKKIYITITRALHEYRSHLRTKNNKPTKITNCREKNINTTQPPLDEYKFQLWRYAYLTKTEFKIVVAGRSYGLPCGLNAHTAPSTRQKKRLPPPHPLPPSPPREKSWSTAPVKMVVSVRPLHERKIENMEFKIKYTKSVDYSRTVLYYSFIQLLNNEYYAFVKILL